MARTTPEIIKEVNLERSWKDGQIDRKRIMLFKKTDGTFVVNIIGSIVTSINGSLHSKDKAEQVFQSEVTLATKHHNYREVTA